MGKKACQETVARTPLISVNPEAERPGPEVGPGYNLQGLPPVICSLPERSLKPFTVFQSGVITLGPIAQIHVSHVFISKPQIHDSPY